MSVKFFFFNYYNLIFCSADQIARNTILTAFCVFKSYSCKLLMMKHTLSFPTCQSQQTPKMCWQSNPNHSATLKRRSPLLTWSSHWDSCRKTVRDRRAIIYCLDHAASPRHLILWTDGLFRMLNRLSFPPKLLCIIQSFHEDMKVTICMMAHLRRLWCWQMSEIAVYPCFNPVSDLLQPPFEISLFFGS